jgi:DNA-binding transcriptional MocR family regulator
MFGRAHDRFGRKLYLSILKSLSLARPRGCSAMTLITSSGKADAKPTINLLRGWPSPHILPTDLIQAASTKLLSNPAAFVPALQYGADPGYQPLREELASWLSNHYSTPRDPLRICVTGGASQSIACILQSFTDPGYTQAIWLTAPCYFIACPIFEDSGFKGRLKAVREDEEGIDLNWLEDGLQSFEGKGPEKARLKDPGPLRKFYRHVIYVVPTCANPSGKTMSLRRRQALVELARKYDALVICDDVYDMLQWPVLQTTTELKDDASASKSVPLPPHAVLPRLSDIDFALGRSSYETGSSLHFGHAISNGSFSKLIAPGMRTGWVEGTQAFAKGLSQTGSTRSGGAPSQTSSAMICEIMRAGQLEPHLAQTVRPALQRRHANALALVKQELEPLGVQARVASLGDVEGDGGSVERKPILYGGYFLWLTLRADGPSAGAIAGRAKKEENLIIAPGPIFEVYGDEKSVQFSHNIRITYSWEEEGNLNEGIRRLGRVLRKVYGEYDRGEYKEDDGALDFEALRLGK